MSVTERISKYLFDSDYRFMGLVGHGFFKKMPDEIVLKKIFKTRMGYPLDLDNPKTFNEKLQWLKLYDRKPIYTTMVDKFAVKQYVANIIGEKYIIPTYGVWNHFDEIDFNRLPDQFVLKCTHDSGGLVIVKDKSKLDKKAAKRKLEKSLRENYYYSGREWPYKNVPPRIIAEKYMEDGLALNKIDGLLDYKFYCFNGEPKFLYVGYANIQNGQKHDLLSFRDLSWEKTPFGRKDHDPIPWEVQKPDQFEKMIEIARLLSKNVPFLRVDLYWINQRIYFSELTLCPGSGFGKFYPNEWETEIGTWLQLPKKRL